MFNRQAEYQTQLEHLVSLAQIPQFKAHAWAQAQMLDAEDSGLFQGMAVDLKAAMAGQANTTASEPQSQGKPR